MADNIKVQSQFVASPNYGKQSKWEKIRRTIRARIIGKLANTPLQFKVYRSYMHYRLSRILKTKDKDESIKHYLTEKPNYGAGIGHQLANWNCGLYFAGKYNLQFAHFPFSTEKWESFLGFGEGEVAAKDLIDSGKYRIVRLPKFDSTSDEEIALIGNIISSYTRKEVLFMLEGDQGYKRQCDTSKILSEKFFKAPSRKNDQIKFSTDTFNIAVHIRRRMKVETDEVWITRGLDNEYFSNILGQTLEIIEPGKKIEIYLFSQGNVEEFPEFSKFENMHYCMDMGPIESVLHMVNADLLISSKSSFSYKPALISKGIQIAPKTFWHAYPDTDQYILADNGGNFDHKKLKNKFI